MHDSTSWYKHIRNQLVVYYIHPQEAHTLYPWLIFQHTVSPVHVCTPTHTSLLRFSKCCIINNIWICTEMQYSLPQGPTYFKRNKIIHRIWNLLSNGHAIPSFFYTISYFATAMHTALCSFCSTCNWLHLSYFMYCFNYKRNTIYINTTFCSAVANSQKVWQQISWLTSTVPSFLIFEGLCPGRKYWATKGWASEIQ